MYASRCPSMTSRCSASVEIAPSFARVADFADELPPCLPALGWRRIVPSGATNIRLVVQLIYADARSGMALLLDGVEIAVEQLKEDPLRPPVIGRDQWCRPRDPSRSSGPAFGSAGGSWRCSCSVVIARVGVVLMAILLGRQAERIPTHRMQDVVPLHAEITATMSVAVYPSGWPTCKPASAWVGEHVQDIGFRHFAGLGGVQSGECAVGGPEILPFLLDRGKVVTHGLDYNRRASFT